jgi:hypothetical protein
MTVDPVNRGQVPTPGPSRANKSLAGGDTRHDGAVRPDAADNADDTVELSATAMELRELTAANSAESNSLSPERLQQVSRRIHDGFYDQEEVVDQVARRVKRDL